MPTAPPKACWFPGCPRLSHVGACAEHAKPREENKTEVRKFRSNRKWRKHSEAKRRANPICPDPHGIHAARGFPVLVRSVHHKTPLSVDLSKGLDHDNTEAQCDECHVISDWIAMGRDATRMIEDAKARRA